MVENSIRRILAKHFMNHGLLDGSPDVLLWCTQRNNLRHHRVADGSLRRNRRTAYTDLSDTMFPNELELFFSKNRIRVQQNLTRFRIQHILCQKTPHESILQYLNSPLRRRRQTGTLAYEIDADDITVILTHDNILCNIDKTTRKITRVSRSKCRIRQTLTGAMGRNKVIRYGKTFTEIGLDWQVDDLTGRIGHESAHTSELTHLLFITAGAGVSHHINWIERIHIFHHGRRYIIRSLRPEGNYLSIALLVRDKTTTELTLNRIDLLFGRLKNILLLRRHDNIGNCNRHAGYAGIMITKILYSIDDNCRFAGSKGIEALSNELAELLFIHADAEAPLTGFLILMVIPDLRRQNLIKDHAAKGCLDKTIALHTALDLCLNSQSMMLVGQKCFLDTRKYLALAQCTWTQNSKIIGTKHHVLCRNDDRTTILWCKNMIGGKHEDTSLCLCLCGQRKMDSHLVAVEISVIRSTSQRMKLQGTAFCKNWLEGLNAETMQRRCTVQQNRMLLDDLLKHIPYLRTCTLDHALSRFNIVCNLRAYKLFHNERLEELESHFLRQTALMQLELRTNNDNRTA